MHQAARCIVGVVDAAVAGAVAWAYAWGVDVWPWADPACKAPTVCMQPVYGECGSCGGRLGCAVLMALALGLSGGVMVVL